jgi:hypothetical protein
MTDWRALLRAHDPLSVVEARVAECPLGRAWSEIRRARDIYEDAVLAMMHQGEQN